MPVPKFIARVNRRVFNPREIKKGERPVLIHTGRTSGTEYMTPLDAHPVDGGYIFIVMYGADSDWVKNVLAAQKASLRLGEATHELAGPRLIPEDEAWQQLSESVEKPPGYLNVTEYLRMDLVTGDAPV